LIFSGAVLEYYSTKNIFKKIRDEEILKNINISINKGEFISIIGPSGSGKSSLLYIMGLLDKPTSGEVIVDGQNIDFSNPKKNISYKKFKIWIYIPVSLSCFRI